MNQSDGATGILLEESNKGQMGSVAALEIITPRPCKTVVISVMKEGGDIEYALIPLPQIYSDAIATAFVALKDYLSHVTLEAVYLKISIKNAGETVWAHVVPSLWNDTVSEGAELRMFSSDSESPACIKEGYQKELERPVVTFKFVSAKSAVYYATTHLPKSYGGTKAVALQMFKNCFKKSDIVAKDINLRGLFRDPTLLASQAEDVLIHSLLYEPEGFGPSNWELFITKMMKEHPDFKLLVTEVR